MARQSIWRVWSAGRGKRFYCRLASPSRPFGVRRRTATLQAHKIGQIIFMRFARSLWPPQIDESRLAPAPPAALVRDCPRRAARPRLAAGLAGVHADCTAAHAGTAHGMGDTGTRETAAQTACASGHPQTSAARPAQTACRPSCPAARCAKNPTSPAAAHHATPVARPHGTASTRPAAVSRAKPRADNSASTSARTCSRACRAQRGH